MDIPSLLTRLKKEGKKERKVCHPRNIDCDCHNLNVLFGR